ncbi:MAG: GntR family transcriptional regulator [Tissierellia bacterium]|nr:GntR family transcriptional regulator [Tissierellia bacterium]
MFIKIDFETEMPIYEQLKRQIIEGIAKGALKKGEQLPSVRQLAEDIGINLHTVNKAYNILKNEGFLTIDRRKGAMVSNLMPEITEQYLELLKEELKYLISNSYCRGMRKEGFLSICESIYDEIDDEKKF